MKKIISAMFILLLISIISIFPQEETKTYPDGNEWEILTEEMKKTYILGFSDGLMVGLLNFLNELEDDKEILESMTGLEIIESMNEEFSYLNTNYEQVIEGLNQLYKDSSNRDIPIMQLIGLVGKKIKGEFSNGMFEITLQFLRKHYPIKK